MIGGILLVSTLIGVEGDRVLTSTVTSTLHGSATRVRDKSKVSVPQKKVPAMRAILRVYQAALWSGTLHSIKEKLIYIIQILCGLNKQLTKIICSNMIINYIGRDSANNS